MPPFHLVKMFLETLLNTLTIPIGIFKKFKIGFHAGIVSNTFWAEIWKTKLTVDDATAVRPSRPSRTRGHLLPLRYRALTGTARTPAGGRWKSFHHCLPVNRPRRTLADCCRCHRACQSACRGTATPPSHPLDQTSATEPPLMGSFPATALARARSPALSRTYKRTPSTLQRSTPSPLPVPTLLSSSLPRNCPKLYKP
jgi:hypothetical protein